MPKIGSPAHVELAQCLLQFGQINDWERNFLFGIQEYKRLSPKQVQWLLKTARTVLQSESERESVAEITKGMRSVRKQAKRWQIKNHIELATRLLCSELVSDDEIDFLETIQTCQELTWRQQQRLRLIQQQVDRAVDGYG